MRLTPLWTRRITAMAAIALAVAALWNAASTTLDILAVRAAHAGVPSSEPTVPPPDYTPPLPMVELNDDQALHNFFAQELERLDMTEITVQERRRAAIGDGLKLVEVEVRALGSLASGRAVLNWAAVNRQGTRLVSATAHPDPEGQAAWTFVMQVGAT